MLIVLLATTLLALTALGAILYFYGPDEQSNLQSLAVYNARIISEKYHARLTYNSARDLNSAAASTFAHQISCGAVGAICNKQNGEQYLVAVYGQRAQPLYPVRPNCSKLPQPDITKVICAVARNQSSLANNGYAKIHAGIEQALSQGTVTTGEVGPSTVGLLSRPFIVQPIIVDDQNGTPFRAGALVMLPLYSAQNTLPPFVQFVGETVLISSAFVALVAAIIAIIFSRTITRPLAKLTSASRVMASGNYDTRVDIHAYGEIGELEHSFNEMGAQLSRDVEELREQELWRRELIMSITHDLATPLTAIAGLGESLVDGVTQSREDYEATGRIIVRETLRLRRLVKDLHVMAKVEAGALQPQRKELRLAALVDEVLAVLAPEFERADVEPSNAIPFILPIVQADADMLTRVFSNLCANAIRHTPPGGSVTIDAVPHGDTLLVSVTDTGEGIPPESVSRVFERFYRADSARQSVTGGSGLGLAIVRAIVEAHGGKVWAENNPNGGARILFTLPIQEVSMQMTQPMKIV
jgi:signal transduction histidine kinase